MNVRQSLVTLILGTLLVPCLARGESAQEAFDKGQAFLAKGDFPAALEWISTAAKADATNQQFVKRYTVVRRVVDFRNKLETEKDPAKWEQLAKALRSFYLREKIYPEALSLAQKMHERLNTTASALILAETQLAADQNAEAVKTLQAIPSDKVTPASQALLAIAFMETAQPAEAKKIMDSLTLPADAMPGTKYLVARAYGKTGDSPKAIASLQAFFESVPPSQLDTFKTQVKALPEFASMASTPEFAQVLETKSKLKESECTGGSDCSSCPVGASCPSGDAAKKGAQPAAK